MISAALCLLKQAIVQENVRTSDSDVVFDGVTLYGYEDYMNDL